MASHGLSIDYARACKQQSPDRDTKSVEHVLSHI